METDKTAIKVIDQIQSILIDLNIDTGTQLKLATLVAELNLTYFQTGIVKGLQMAREVIKEELKDDDENYSSDFVI